MVKTIERDVEALTRRAYAAWFRAGGTDQPGSASGVEVADGKDFVVLRNAGGVLAVFRVQNDGLLKRLKRWPSGLGE